MSCPKGKIIRKPYYTKKGTYVKSTCVPDKGAKGKTPESKKVLPKPKSGLLSRFGYSTYENDTFRHRSINKVINKTDEEPVSIYRHLNLLANYTKVSNPRAHKIYRKDMKYIKNKYKFGSNNKRSSRKSKRSSRKSKRSSRKSKRSSRRR